MSTNCIRCIRNARTGPDLLCDECRRDEAMAREAGYVAALERIAESDGGEASALTKEIARQALAVSPGHSLTGGQEGSSRRLASEGEGGSNEVG